MSTNPLEAAAQRTEAAFNALSDHEAAWGTDETTIPQGQRQRRERLRSAFGNATRELEDATTRADQIDHMRELAKNPANLESGDGPA